ncbi:MAG: FAD-dependent thymidylate synthase [candidate division WOR-3 bacterium]|nr:FAD-dependent thymidylate synthase [candidate division WOR-3 bacterium]
MRVILAGYNIDLDALKEYRKGNIVLTPESISAAYARISRSPKSIDELRENARHEVARARASNQKIIFEMGHHSVAEHAVFNFDILDISRKAVEEFEKFRLCSYTEKSQRYVTLEGDYVVPEEMQNKNLRVEFKDMIRLQNELYKLLFEKIKNYNFTRLPRLDKNFQDRRLLENLAKEDARYILSLATQTQVGATVNARNLELMIRRFASHHLAEIRELGRKLFGSVKKISPSIILFYEANDYDQKTYEELLDHTAGINSTGKLRREHEVQLVDHTNDGDNKILATLLFSVSGGNYLACLRTVRTMSRRKKLDLFKKACGRVELYDVLLREFEYADLSYSLIVSAGCFGQLKRHRVASIVWSDYDPNLGVTVPQSVKAVREENGFLQVVDMTERFYDKLEKKLPRIGSYILTNAHRRRVLMKVNLRELYHISRLREDPTAQWDIRSIAHQMSVLAKKAFPITTMLLGGKSDYPEIYRRLYGQYPRVKEVPAP